MQGKIRKYKILVGKPNRKNDSEDTDLDGRNNIECIIRI